MRKMLWLGVVAGPIFVAALLIEGATRPDYDSLRHPGSSLALGPGGWAQTINFILAGLLTLGFSAALRAFTGTHKAWLIAIWGLGLIGAGVFTSDPISGYPLGTPAIPVPTATGRAHDLISLVGFLAIAVSMLAFVTPKRPVWSAFSVTCFLVFVVGIVLSSAGFEQREPWVDVAGLLQRVAIVAAWTWLTTLAYSAIEHR